jgi:DNA invertase Pin-like site-specific DNA recombinase
METLDDQGHKKPLANLLFGIQKEYADYERELLRERIISGQQEARRQGKHIGRKAGTVKSKENLLLTYSRVVRKLKEGTTSIRETAAICGVSKNTVLKVKRLLTPTPA